MKNWITYKIKDIGQIVSGSTPRTDEPKFWNGNIKWVSPKEISVLKTPYLEDTRQKITELGFRSCSTTMLPKGSVLFSSRAPIGLVAIANIEVCTNQGFKSLILNSNFDSLFIYYLLKFNVKKLDRLGTGTTFRELSKATFEKFEVLLPENKSDQIRIATVLSRAEALIAQRKESLRLLDELLRGAFLEMFGDPVRNEKGWEKQKLGQLAKSRLGKMLDKEKPKGIHIRKYLANTNVQWFKIKFDSLSEMPFLDKELSELELKYGDLLICEGGEVGRTAIWKNEMPNVYFQKAIHRVRPDLSEVTSEYLAYFFWFTATITKFKKIVVTSTISHLTGEKLDKIQVPVPPIDLQKQFTHLVEKVEILRGRYTESLAELEKLYGSLSQLAFEGDLDLDFEVDENLLVAHEVAEQPQQIGDSLVFDEKALRYLIKNKLSGSFSFDTIWGAIQSADFATPPQYNDVKTLIFKWLNAKKPILTQTFHPTEKRLEFTLNK